MTVRSSSRYPTPLVYGGDGRVYVDGDLVLQNGAKAYQDNGSAETAYTAGAVTGVTATSPLQSSGGTAPVLSLIGTGIPNANLAVDVARANHLVNGGFEHAQRGTAAVAAGGAGTLSLDMWEGVPIAAAAFTMAPDTATVDTGSGQSAKLVIATASGVNLCYFRQKIEGFKRLRGRPQSFSCRLNAPGSGTVEIVYYDGTAWTQAALLNFVAGWQTLKAENITPTAAATALHWGLRFASTGTFYVDNAMLVIGAVAADFAPLPPADDFERCIRYYEQVGGSAANEAMAAGQATAAGTAQVMLAYAPKAVAPTISVSAASDFQCTVAAGTGTACTGLVAANVGLQSAQLNASGMAGLVAGNATLLQAVNTNARIKIEANP